MPPSSARAAICAARMSSVLTSPPSSSSAFLGDSARPSVSPPLRRSANCGPRRRSRRSVCPAWRPACARLPRRTGKVWMVQTTIFLSPDSAAASSPLLLPSLPLIVATTPVCPLEIEDRFLQLRVDHRAVGDDQHGIEDLLGLRRRAGRRGNARSRRWSSSCPSRPSAGRDTCRPARLRARPPAACASRRADGSGGR